MLITAQTVQSKHRTRPRYLDIHKLKGKGLLDQARADEESGNDAFNKMIERAKIRHIDSHRFDDEAEEQETLKCVKQLIKQPDVRFHPPNLKISYKKIHRVLTRVCTLGSTTIFERWKPLRCWGKWDTVLYPTEKDIDEVQALCRKMESITSKSQFESEILGKCKEGCASKERQYYCKNCTKADGILLKYEDDHSSPLLQQVCRAVRCRPMTRLLAKAHPFSLTGLVLFIDGIFSWCSVIIQLTFPLVVLVTVFYLPICFDDGIMGED